MPAAGPYIIRYRYPGTTNGQPVGLVYVQRVADVIPNYPRDVFSYTKTPAEATTWDTEAEARSELARRSWGTNGGVVLALEEAEQL